MPRKNNKSNNQGRPPSRAESRAAYKNRDDFRSTGSVSSHMARTDRIETIGRKVTAKSKAELDQAIVKFGGRPLGRILLRYTNYNDGIIGKKMLDGIDEFRKLVLRQSGLVDLAESSEPAGCSVYYIRRKPAIGNTAGIINLAFRDTPLTSREGYVLSTEAIAINSVYGTPNSFIERIIERPADSPRPIFEMPICTFMDPEFDLRTIVLPETITFEKLDVLTK